MLMAMHKCIFFYCGFIDNFSYLLQYVLFMFSNPDVAQYMSFPAVRNCMQRARVQTQPSVPETLASLNDTLHNSYILRNIWKESVTFDNDKTAIILSTNYLLEALSSATEIYVDGTFSVST